MGIITKEVEVKLWGTNIKHYHNLGYQGKQGDIITVKVEDLSDGCNVRVAVTCDYCGTECNPRYVEYLNSIKMDGTYACSHCGIHKAEKTMYKKYGVLNYSSTKGCREKVVNTMMARYGIDHVSKSEEFLKRKCDNNKEKYGVEHTLQVKEFRDKGTETMLQKYGVEHALQNEEIMKQVKDIVEQRYGTPYASQNPEIKEKILQTNLKKYGCKTPSQLPEIREKMAKALYANSSQKVSRQQRYISNLYRGILNYPISYYNVDIYLPDDNLIIEYDGGGHMLNVVTGRETTEEYTHREIIRYNVIKREGYKQMRIISTKDLLPSDSTLFQMLDYTRNYFSKYPNHSWIEFNIDTSSIRSAENIDGSPYDFGELRTIKDSDLNTNTIKDSDVETNETDNDINILTKGA